MEDAIITARDKKGDTPNTTVAAPASSKEKIARLIENVKPEDENILANLPAVLLNEEQRKAKVEGLKEKGVYLGRKADNEGKYKKGRHKNGRCDHNCKR